MRPAKGDPAELIHLWDVNFSPHTLTVFHGGYDANECPGDGGGTP